MIYFRIILVIVALVSNFTLPIQALAQSDAARLDELERRVERVENRSGSNKATGGALYICAAFCALWAQQTGRNAWLWFFLGLFFSVITLLVLLYKNADERMPRR